LICPERKLKNLSKKNTIFSNFIGMGYYGTYTPNVIIRNILENPGWYTSYTPYQPEVAQGRLEMLLNFQQMIIDFTGMDIANASLLDEGTAAAEAMGLSHRLDKKDNKIVFISNDCHPQTIEVVKTRSEPLGLKVVIGNDEDLSNISEDIICGILQYPGTLGDIKDPSENISKIKKRNGKSILVCDLLSLAKLKTPAELGADISNLKGSERNGRITEEDVKNFIKNFKKNILVATIASLGVILGAAYMLWLYKRIIFGKLINEDVKKMVDLKRFEIVTLWLLVLPIIFFGFYPEPLINSIEVSVANMIDMNDLDKINKLALGD